MHFHGNRSLVTVGSDNDVGGRGRCGAGRCVRGEGVRGEGVRSRAARRCVRGGAGSCVRGGMGDVGSCGDSVERFEVEGRETRLAALLWFTHVGKWEGV